MKKELTGVILAGGESQRMGEDKGLMDLNGQSMVEYSIEALEPLVSKVLIITNNDEYSRFGYPVYNDLEKGKGPLMGLYTALSNVTTPSALLLSCDVPFVTSVLLEFVADQKEGHEIAIAVERGKKHPLIGCYDREILSTIKEQLNLNQLKLQAMIDQCDVKYVNCDHFDANLFKNVNSKKDL